MRHSFRPLSLLSLLTACGGTGDPIGGDDTGSTTPPGETTDDTAGEDSAAPEPAMVALADADAVLWGDAAGDYAGSTVAFVGDVTGDGSGDLLVGVPADAKGAGAAGSVVVVPGPLSGESTLAEAGHALAGAGLETAGLAIAGLGDVSGDGQDDFAVGAPYSSGGGVQQGAVYIFTTATTESGDLSEADVTLVGGTNYILAGWSLGSGGDLNGDGQADLVVGAKWQSAGSALYAGAAYIFTELPAEQGDMRDADHQLSGEDAEDVAGQSVAIVDDVDGDGKDDVLVGAVWQSPDDERSHAGAAYLVTDAALSGSGPISLADATAKMVGQGADDLAGWDVASAGDVNGDGSGDILVSAPAHTEVVGYEEAGATYLLFGPVEGTIELADADARLIGDELLEWSGASVHSAGDQDGDGLPDIAVGSIYRSPGEGYIAGGVALFTGVGAGDTWLSEAMRTYAGAQEYDAAGWDIDAGVDMNGDGVADLLVGASGADRDKDTDLGSVHVFYGPLVSQ